MPKADVYYYPSGLGHIGVNIIFSESEIPEKDKYTILVYSKANPTSHWENQLKLEARRKYRPAVFLNEKGEFSIYGYKDGSWQETPLTNLSEEELTLLQSLPFSPVTTKENDKYYFSSYKNGAWQKTPLPDNYINSVIGGDQKSIQPSNPLFKLIQEGHPQFKRTEYFFDYGGLYDFEEDKLSRGDPIRISLPPITKSISEVFNLCKYHYDEPPLDSSYDLFTHNCAHATMDMLHYAGYIPKKPGKSFALLPLTVAKKACDLGHHSRALFRKQLLESTSKTDPKKLINQLIGLSINRLEDTIHFSYGKYIGGCSEEMQRLENLKYNGSVESIECLLKASEEASPYTAKELEDCIALLDPKLCFNAGLARLMSVATNSKSKQSALVLKRIAFKLQIEFESFKTNPSSYELFAKNCSELLKEAAPILKKESSYGLKILKNLALALCGLIVFYLMAAFINKANSGNFLFFNEPCREKIGLEMQANIKELKF